MRQALMGARAGSCTLYQVEDDLQAWVNTLDGVDQESTRQEILQEIGQAVRLARGSATRSSAFFGLRGSGGVRRCRNPTHRNPESLDRARSAGTGSTSHPHCR